MAKVRASWNPGSTTAHLFSPAADLTPEGGGGLQAYHQRASMLPRKAHSNLLLDFFLSPGGRRTAAAGGGGRVTEPAAAGGSLLERQGVRNPERRTEPGARTVLDRLEVGVGWVGGGSM